MNENRATFAVLILLFLLVSFGLSFAEVPDSATQSIQERIIDRGRNDNQVMQHVDYLANGIGARVTGSDEVRRACEWARDRFVDFGLAQVHIEESSVLLADSFLEQIINFFSAAPPIYNVVADITGHERPDEYVIIGAHIDSHGAGTGATDNAAGVAAAMEAARILVESGARPRRTIRFILFDAEERGKRGSLTYVAEHADIMPKVSAMINMDQGSNAISGIYATAAMREDFAHVFAPVNTLNPEIPFAVKQVKYLSETIKECCGSGGTSDHGPFLSADVPAFFWLQDGRQPVPYYAHTEYDTYDKVYPEFLQHSATVIAIAALRIADLDHLLSRENLSESPTASAK